MFLLVPACAQGDAETDTAAQRLTDVITFPRQNSAEGYARAALNGTGANPNGGVSVLVAQDIRASSPKDASAHLEFQIHRDGSEAGWTKTDPITACYSVDFGYYGVVSGPTRIPCPANVSPITLPPMPPPARVPGTFDQRLRAVLTALPVNTTQSAVFAAVSHGMPAPQPDPDTHLTGSAPDLAVTVRGNDIGVSYRTVDSTNRVDCLFGSRVGGDVRVWRPSWQQLQPGELICNADEALAREGTTPPH